MRILSESNTIMKKLVPVQATSTIVFVCLMALSVFGVICVCLAPETASPLPGDYANTSRCPTGQFKLGAMDSCSAWLDCQRIRTEVHPLNLLGKGYMKEVFLSELGNQTVVLSRSYTTEHQQKVLHGISMLLALQAPQVTQLIGLCPEELTVVTEFHPHGQLYHLDSVLAGQRHHNTWELRLRMATSYVNVISWLHDNHRVMCDTFNLGSTLTQFLVTNDFDVVVNDLDWLPEVDRSRGLLVKCADIELSGDFVAPEQRWPFGDQGLAFNDELMPPYDQKTDIWKIPQVTEYLMSDVPGADLVLFHLSHIHTLCKMTDPAMRPSAEEVLSAYRLVYAKMVRNV